MENNIILEFKNGSTQKIIINDSGIISGLRNLIIGINPVLESEMLDLASNCAIELDELDATYLTHKGYCIPVDSDPVTQYSLLKSDGGYIIPITLVSNVTKIKVTFEDEEYVLEIPENELSPTSTDYLILLEFSGEVKIIDTLQSLDPYYLDLIAKIGVGTPRILVQEEMKSLITPVRAGDRFMGLKVASLEDYDPMKDPETCLRLRFNFHDI